MKGRKMTGKMIENFDFLGKNDGKICLEEKKIGKFFGQLRKNFMFCTRICHRISLCLHLSLGFFTFLSIFSQRFINITTEGVGKRPFHHHVP